MSTGIRHESAGFEPPKLELQRQYFPKNTDFKIVTQLEVKRAVKRLNSRPRKFLGFKTPDQLMSDFRVALAA